MNNKVKSRQMWNQREDPVFQCSYTYRTLLMGDTYSYTLYGYIVCGYRTITPIWSCRTQHSKTLKNFCGYNSLRTFGKAFHKVLGYVYGNLCPFSQKSTCEVRHWCWARKGVLISIPEVVWHSAVSGVTENRRFLCLVYFSTRQPWSTWSTASWLSCSQYFTFKWHITSHNISTYSSPGQI